MENDKKQNGTSFTEEEIVISLIFLLEKLNKKLYLKNLIPLLTKVITLPDYYFIKVILSWWKKIESLNYFTKLLFQKKNKSDQNEKFLNRM